MSDVDQNTPDTQSDLRSAEVPFFKSRFVLQGIAGGIVAAGLLVAWIIGYLNPIMTAQQEVNEQQNKVALLRVEEQKLYLARSRNELEAAQAAFQVDIEVLRRENKLLQDQLNAATISMGQLKKNYTRTQQQLIEKAKVATTPNEKAHLELLAMQAAGEAHKLSVDLTEIQQAQLAVVGSESRITQQLQSATSIRQQVLPISWVKPSDWLGRHYSLRIDSGLYLWPTELDSESGTATIIVNTTNTGRMDGTAIINEEVIRVGEEVEFSFDDSSYRLRLLSIRRAGKLPTDAGYFVAEKIK